MKKLLSVISWIILVFSNVRSEPLEPGQPGGPWTELEIDVVREKVHRVVLQKMETVPILNSLKRL